MKVVKRKFMTVEQAGYLYHDTWSKGCVFGVQKNPTSDKRCKGCPFRIERDRPRCIERNVRFMLVKKWVTTVVSVISLSTIGIWSSSYLTEEQLEELMWTGEYEFVKHDHEHWRFYRLHRLHKIIEGCRGSENNDLLETS